MKQDINLLDGRAITIAMSSEQARQFALIVLGDIKKYVEAHTEDFMRFVQQKPPNRL